MISDYIIALQTKSEVLAQCQSTSEEACLYWVREQMKGNKCLHLQFDHPSENLFFLKYLRH